MITEQQLKLIYPNSSSENRRKYLPFFEEFLPDYEVTTKERMWAYFAQIGHESGELIYCEELASGKAYEGRKDLGNLNEGDGVKYKGRGLIQLTGRNNYALLSKTYHTDFITHPERLSTPPWAVVSSFWFWEYNELNAIADSGDFEKLTRKINGGINGLQDRLRLYELCKRYIT